MFGPDMAKIGSGFGANLRNVLFPS